MKHTEIFEKLWKDYTSQNPAVERVYDLFIEKEVRIENDHIAFRTFNDNTHSSESFKFFHKTAYSL